MRIILTLSLILFSPYIFSLDQYIGLTPNEVVAEFGAPDYVYSERGESQDQDDVIFFFDNRIYVYFNQNRAWQLRVDSKYENDILGVKLGDNIDNVKSILGEPYKIYEDSLLYKRPDAGYPVYVRIYYENSKVNDLYIFRGDY